MKNKADTFVIFPLTAATYSAVKETLAQNGYHRESVKYDGSKVLDVEGLAFTDGGFIKPTRISNVFGDLPYAVDPDVKWRYDTAPHGVKVFLLTRGGVAVEGTWRDGGSFIAWHPLFSRDKEVERRLGLG